MQTQRTVFRFRRIFVVFSTIFLSFIVHSARGFGEKQGEYLHAKNSFQEIQKNSGANGEVVVVATQKGVQEDGRKEMGLPTHLKIPRIGVDAAINRVGITPEGAMEVPQNIIEAGWFDLGPRPGEKGNAVIAGHLNGRGGGVGVFTNLYLVKEGDAVYVEDDEGRTLTFVVRESRTYDPGRADDVFDGSDGTHLNLITCTGAWDKAQKSYSKRLVVFADIVSF